MGFLFEAYETLTRLMFLQLHCWNAMSKDMPDPEGSTTDVEQSTERARRLDRSVYRQAFRLSTFGTKDFCIDKVMIERPVSKELLVLIDELPCENRGDVIEYLLVYWASEGRLEEEYDYVGSESKESGRERTLEDRNLYNLK